MVVQGVPAHQHCEICQKVVKVDERFCSSACEDKHEEAQAYKKKAMWRFVAILAGILLLFQLLRMGVI